MGGCLSIITALLGTPFAPKLDGAICFFEDVNEPLYRVDRMLVHLRIAGALDGVRGIVLGALNKTLTRQELREAVLDIVDSLNIPILFGIPSGHGETNITLPLGVRVHLDGDQGVLSFLESGVEDKMD